MTERQQGADSECEEGDVRCGVESGDLQARLEEAEREREQFKSIAARAQADLVNYRRRVEEEKDEIRRNATSSLLFKILSTVDNLDRALAMIPSDQPPGWGEGIELVRRNVVNVLEAEGVTQLVTLGKPYDPEYAAAIQFRETDDGDEGTVVEVYQEGYMYRNRVLRAAQVVVAKRPEQPEPIESNNDKETT